MKRALFVAAAAAAWVWSAAQAAGAEYDGSRLLICANTEASDCGAGQACARGQAGAFGAPTFFRIDFANKTIVGPKRSTPIVSQDRSASQLLLQGTELGYAWSIALDTTDGRVAASLVDRDGVIVLFGNCTPL